MIEGIPRISALIICYKQEKLIKRALDSLLIQKDYLYEICVSDDCSPDNTWQVLLDYQSKYPDIIKLHRNDPNVGIFENLEQSRSMPTGDVIYHMAGDDEAVDGYLRAVVEYIQDNHINYKQDEFCIYGDYMVKYPNGDSVTYSHKAIRKCPHDAIRLVLRGIVCGRSTCYSINVLKHFGKISQGRSHIVEAAMDCQVQLYSKDNYYLPALGNIYYAMIGVSVYVEDKNFQERVKIWPFAVDYLRSNGVVLNRKDLNYVNYIVSQMEFRHHKSFSAMMKMVRFYITSFDFSLPSGNGFKHLMFAIIRRFPHKKPITF